MVKHNRSAAPTAGGRLGTAFRTTFFVLVGTGVSIAHIGCQSAEEPEETGPTRVVLDEVGLAFAALPGDCTRVEPSDLPLELVCELVETTANPAGPPSRVWLELGEPSKFGIELDDVAKSHRSFFGEMPEGELLGGQILVAPLGRARYTRGRFLGDDGTTYEQMRMFLLHPIENRLVTLVAQYPAGDKADSKGRVLQMQLLLGDMEVADAPAPAGEPEVAE